MNTDTVTEEFRVGGEPIVRQFELDPAIPRPGESSSQHALRCVKDLVDSRCADGDLQGAVKAAAPNQLYLGCRFYKSNAPVLAAAVKYCDVVSYNLYRFSVSDFKLPIEADVPIMIGEFSFFAADVGMMGGFWMVPDQNVRAANFKDYVLGALRHPQFVGCHWFQYRDEPTTARSYDEENYQIGFIDIADTPYGQMVGVARKIGKGMYKTRLDAKEVRK